MLMKNLSFFQPPVDFITYLTHSHGTRCAGEVAAIANNSICGSGVAYSAHVGGMVTSVPQQHNYYTATSCQTAMHVLSSV